MKTLKKALCLVLSVVMVLGLCAISVSAAPDTEKADKEYQTALKVLEEVGALQGVDDAGNLNPKAELTRIEGAVIVARLLGYFDETKLDGSKAKAMFPDIPAWAGAAGAASLLVDEGISDGTTDAEGKTIFGSTQALTGDMFAKWLLCALGYDATIEGMTGSDWEIAVNKLLMKEAPLDANITGTFPATKALTREQAAQMMLDALQTTMVEYSGGAKVTVDGIEIVTGAVRSNQTIASAKVGKAISDDLGDTVATKYDLQLGEYLYNGKLSLVAGLDSYKKSAESWYYPDTADSHKVASTTTATVLKTYTKGSDVTGKALAAIGVWDYGTIANTEDGASDVYGIGVYTNGVDTGYMLNSDVANKYTATQHDLCFPDGAKIEVVDDNGNGNPDRVIVTYGYLAKVTAVNPAKADGTKRTVTLTVYVPGIASGVTGVKYTTEEFAKGDYVIAYPSALLGNSVLPTAITSSTTILNAELATPTSGAVTAYTGGNATSYKALTVDGGSSKALGSFVSLKPARVDVKDKVNVYELNGYVIGILGESNATTDLSKLVYVLGDDAGNAANDVTDPTTGKLKGYVRVIHADTGAFEVIGSADPSALSSGGGTVVNATGFYQLSTNSTSGETVFTKVKGVDGALTNPTRAYAYMIDNDTVFSAVAWTDGPTTITASTKSITTAVYWSDQADTSAYALSGADASHPRVYIDDNTKFVFFNKDAVEIKTGAGAYTLPASTQIVLTKDSNGNYVAATVIVGKAFSSGVTADSTIIFMEEAVQSGENTTGRLYSVYELDGDAEKYAISNATDFSSIGYYTYAVNESGKGVISFLDDSGAAQWNGGSATTGVKKINASSTAVEVFHRNGGKDFLTVGSDTIEVTGATVNDLAEGDYDQLDDLNDEDGIYIYAYIVNNVATTLFVRIN